MTFPILKYKAETPQGRRMVILGSSRKIRKEPGLSQFQRERRENVNLPGFICQRANFSSKGLFQGSRQYVTYTGRVAL